MSTFHLVLIGGVALGLLQLAAGVALGLWIARRGPKPGHASRDTQRAAKLAADLHGLTTTVASSVRRHNDAIQAIDHRLREEAAAAPTSPASSGDEARDPQTDPLTAMVVGVVGEMLSANRKLQDELHSAEAALERQASELVEHRRDALTDALTGLPNRRALDNLLRDLVDGWRRHGTPFSVLMMDIDHFKRFNDTHGHQAGDAALQAFARAISGAVRKHDLVARYGGEEFALLLPHTQLSEAAAAVRKVRQALADLRVTIDGQSLPVTGSGGLATILSHEAGDALVGRADEALYAAKHAGRDRVYRHNGGAVEPLNDLAGGDPHTTLADGLREACADLRAGLNRFMQEPTDSEPAGKA
ncbi:MAG: GGDEF domain-containing protein [Planctomycetota bacterium]